MNLFPHPHHPQLSVGEGGNIVGAAEKKPWEKNGNIKFFVYVMLLKNHIHTFFSKYTLNTIDGKSVELEPNSVDIKRYEKTVHVEEITPSVIEPSFGIGRVMYAVLEHSFRQREGDEKRSVVFWLQKLRIFIISD